MILSTVFFISSFLAGLAVHELIQLNLSSLFKYPFSVVIGIVLTSISIFFTSYVFGLSSLVVIFIIFLFLIISLFIFHHRLYAFSITEKLFTKKNITPIIGLVLMFIVIVLLFSRSIYQNETGIIAGNRLVWTDWPIHFAITNSFVKGNNYPPQNPQFAGENLAYPFFSDFLSSILITLGSSIIFAYIIPGIILATASLILLYYLGTLLVKNKNIALIGLFIAIFWGGLGFIYFIQDLLTSNYSLSTLSFSAREYTFYEDKNLWFFSFLYSEILPQRSFLFGLPLFLISIILMTLGLEKSKKNFLIFSGITIGIMPFFHMHSYLSILMLSLTYMSLVLVGILKNKGFVVFREKLETILAFFIIPIAGLGLIQLPFFSSLDLRQTIGVNLGWMKGNENFILFWFKNTGFFWPLWIYAIFKLRISKAVRNIALASVILFILPNLLRFAPWPYDNLKIFTYWYLIGAFFVANFLYFIAKKSFIGKIISIILFISLTLSGVIEVSSVILSDQSKIRIWSLEDIELARVIEDNTEPNSIVLTAAVHNHPASTLGGRKAIIGFPGNAWSWGYPDWKIRERDVTKMLQADPYLVEELLDKYQVDYVLISSWERNFEPQLNQDYFQENYKLTIGNNDFKLYKI